jgi:hypothetical protein
MIINHNFKMRTDDSLFISVFNIHEPDERRANKAYAEVYGKRALKKLRNHIKEEGGIMCIFNQDPTDDLVMYALMLTQAQNTRTMKEK